MWLSSPTTFSLLATLLVICFENLPTSSTFPTSSNNNSRRSSTKLQSRSLDNFYACFDTGPNINRRAKFNDCARAAVQLPNLIDPKTFHYGGDRDRDPYALPKVKTHNSCQVRVELRFGRSDQSSWLGINVAMGKIMDACSSGYGQYETTGGQILAGTQDFISITVERTLGKGLDKAAGVNDTAVTAQ